MRNVKLLFLCGFLLIAGCTPYGITGSPEKDAPKSQETAAEKKAMETPDHFSVTLQAFENEIAQYAFFKEFEPIQNGLKQSDGPVQFEYKSKDLKNEDSLQNIYLTINVDGEEFSTASQQTLQSLEMICDGLNQNVDLVTVIKRIKANETSLYENEQLSIELMNFKNDVQIIISPKV
ncbi:hypothetical protein Q9R23_12590 [Exiguobacterium sp. BRG2]|uniref:hypothetical protein n=1 Tax=Exiguobacterium sp. BRG2 TaxID=2962584 RepID=UPI0028818481|nr:hypothetical protein [Exiguobacterium sp. BRG2]MDT0173808.1 hypothetical protein [Exiguobacterium sp. BRG2]